MQPSGALNEDGPPDTRRGEAASWLGNVWIAAAFLFVVALLLRLADIGQLARFDELYTLLAARGWMVDGVPRIADGVYDRAELYTALVGTCLKLFGDNLVVARMPSVLFGSLLVVAVFLWTDAVAGRMAAWIAGLVVALSSIMVEMAQYARFYALFGLAFWLGAIGVYALTTGPWVNRGRRIVLLVGTVLCLLIAHYVQPLTVFGAAALAVWVAAVLLLPGLGPIHIRLPWPALVAVALIGVGVVAAALFTGLADRMMARFLLVPLTVTEHAGQFWFYHLHLIERYPTFWPIVPILALAALAAHPRPVSFALLVFGTAFLALSIAGHKSFRYIAFALPFLFVVWAIGLASLWDTLWSRLRTALAQVVSPVPPRLRPALVGCLVAGGVAFLLLANGSSARTLLRPLGVQLEKGFSAGWPDAVPRLQPLVRDADVVVTSHELHALYYLGRADIVLSIERLAEFARDEFAQDGRTGLPVISGPESLDLVMSCYPSGVLITETIKGWRAPTVIDEATADFIDLRMEPVEVPGRYMMAFRWETSASGGPPAGCDAIPGFGEAQMGG